MFFSDFTETSLIALISFAFVSSITPGPNNFMLLYSGARFGFRQSITHLLGINLGFSLMLILCCLGIASIFLNLPYMQTVLKTFGCAYLFRLAYKMWKNGIIPSNEHLQTVQTESSQSQQATPLTFMQAALFQYVNPKAWMMGLSLSAAYFPTGEHIVINTLLAVIVFTAINFMCLTFWLHGGVILQLSRRSKRITSACNGIIIALTLFCAFTLWL